MFKNLNNLTDIEKFAKIWQTELNMEYLKPEKNVRLSFKDIGPFCEYLATSFLPGYTGGGSGGMGFDLFNKKDGKAFEIKSCCTIQNAKCLNCNSKFNSLFSTVCPICKSSNFININDSRFGINADETLKQIEHDIFAGFIFFHISQTNNDTIKHNLSVKVETFILQFNSSLKQIQLEYFINQNYKMVTLGKMIYKAPNAAVVAASNIISRIE